jgi:hypothetical protein
MQVLTKNMQLLNGRNQFQEKMYSVFKFLIENSNQNVLKLFATNLLSNKQKN